MKRSKSSKRWLEEHHRDPFVKKSHAEGQRSRAVYKLKAIQEKDLLLKPGMRVVDLGAAPGGWSEFAAECVGHKGHVIALDILEMAAIPNVTFIQGDFTEDAIYEKLLVDSQEHAIDVVLSDMAPNISGEKAVDQPRSMYLVELALDLAQQILKPGGAFCVKVFQGTGFDEFLQKVRQCFAEVRIRKPEASRARSKECYIVAKGYQHLK